MTHATRAVDSFVTVCLVMMLVWTAVLILCPLIWWAYHMVQGGG